MLFNSWQFALFFPIAVGAYWLLPPRARWAWLLATSCLFYAAFVPAYLLVLFAVIGVDYAAGLLIGGSAGAARGRWLGLSVGANLALLGTFKYFDFFAANANALAGLIGWNLPIPILQLLLPIGLSFHVFQSLSYTIEVYRGNQAPERHLGIYAVYVMFWPQLVAGPIERPQNLLPQFHAHRTYNPERMARGLRRMAWGLFKKVVVADRLAPAIDPIFANPGAHDGPTLAIAAAFFAIQVYCDFSGYSDIALGAAETMGIDLMENFRRPFFARSISEFWRRWHISLSSWFNDYVFTPLAFALRDRGKAGLALAAIATFMLAGIWHGAGWTFVVYGLWHGLAIAWDVVTRAGRRRVAARFPSALWAAAGWATTFAFVCVGFIFFRCASLADAWTMITRLPVGWGGLLAGVDGLRTLLAPLGHARTHVVLPVLAIAVLLACEVLQERTPIRPWLAARPAWQRYPLYWTGLLAIALLGAFEARSFIYFQF